MPEVLMSSRAIHDTQVWPGGDKVQFVEMEGRVYLKRGERDVAAAFGLLKARKTVRQADIDKAILKGWSRRARG